MTTIEQFNSFLKHPMSFCVFFSEFDAASGPKLVYKVPNEFNIDDFSSFYIPKSFFCNRILCVEIDHYLLISHPVYIEDVKYDRNIFAFNIGAILDLSSIPNEEDDVIPYDKEETEIKPKLDIRHRMQHIIRKIAIKLKEFEIMNQFITKDAKRKNIRYLLDVLKAKLLTCDQLTIMFDDLNFLSVHISQPEVRRIQIDDIYDYSVPMPSCSLEEMDISCPNIKRIAMEVNGIDSIKRISIKAECAIELCKMVIQQFYYFGLVELVDIFQFRNSYALTPEFLPFCNDPRAKNLALQYICKLSMASLDVSVYYSRIIPGEHVSDFIQRVVFPMDLLDIRRFFIYGIIHKIIRRIREYPILRRDGKLRHYHSSSLLSQTDYSGKMNEILPLVRNNKDMDELCLLLNLNYSELQKIFQQQFSEDDQFLVSLCK